MRTNEFGGSLGAWGVRTRPMPDATGDADSVPAMTIPEIVRRAGFPRIDLLKVDIEGAELELFSRNTQDWLPGVQQLVIETHDRFKPVATAAVQAAMQGLDFDQRRSGENLVFIRRRPAEAPTPASVLEAARIRVAQAQACRAPWAWAAYLVSMPLMWLVSQKRRNWKNSSLG